MIRRWMIRGMAVGLLMLCVGACGVSLWRGISIYYWSATHGNFLGLEWGRICFWRIAPISSRHRPKWLVYAEEAQDWRDLDAKADFKVLGFTYDRGPFGWGVTLPLWFPTLLSAALLWAIWRKTRPEHKGFPVDAPPKPDAPRANP